MAEKNKGQTLLALLALLLWLVSTAIAFLLILPVLDSLITIYAAFWADPNPIGQAFYLGVSIRQAGVLVLAVLFVIVAIGGAEYHFQNFNTPKSWHFMFMTYAIEFNLFLLTIFF